MSFTLTESQLETAFRRARLQPRHEGAIVFGIRGCTPAGATSGTLANEHELALTTIDYLHARCTIGYWRPGQGFAVFAGSTVPAERYVKKAKAAQGEGANQLCYGLHRGYRKGTHNSTSAKYGHRALRMERAVPVMRTADDLDYDADDRIEYETAYDNIHCGWVANSQTPGYSSAGCQVVVGTANPETGPWKQFARLLYGDGQIEFDYSLFSGTEMQRNALAGAAETLPIALRYGSEGDEVEVVQQKLTALGYPTMGTDGVFGWRTLVAVFRFQKQAMGIRVPDGIVGTQTLTALGLEEMPQPAPLDLAALNGNGAAAGPAAIAHAPDGGLVFTWKTVHSDHGKCTHHYAETDGQRYYAGHETKPNGFVRKGLVQSVKRLVDVGAHKYRPADHADEFGYWSRLVVPTGTAESELLFERVNTYDRAAFTFGFLQAAAHLPGENFILLFKEMLSRPEAPEFFPDLALRPSQKGPRLFQITPQGEVDLEVAEPRDGGSPEQNLKRFMAYLNPTLDLVEDQEKTVVARLSHWTRTVDECRRLQVKHAVAALKNRMGHVRDALRGRPVDQCLMAADARYQGRSGPTSIANALASSSPYAELLKLGRAGHAGRIDTVDGEIRRLMQDAEISALRFDPASPTLFRREA